MIYSQSSCLLDGLVALSLAREREDVTAQEKRNSVKGHALSREKPLTFVTNYKMKTESSHMLLPFRRNDTSKLRHPNNHRKSDFQKDPKHEIL